MCGVGVVARFAMPRERGSNASGNDGDDECNASGDDGDDECNASGGDEDDDEWSPVEFRFDEVAPSASELTF